jgi:hypothetical protein
MCPKDPASTMDTSMSMFLQNKSAWTVQHQKLMTKKKSKQVSSLPQSDIVSSRKGRQGQLYSWISQSDICPARENMASKKWNKHLPAPTQKIRFGNWEVKAWSYFLLGFLDTFAAASGYPSAAVPVLTLSNDELAPLYDAAAVASDDTPCSPLKLASTLTVKADSLTLNILQSLRC